MTTASTLNTQHTPTTTGAASTGSVNSDSVAKDNTRISISFRLDRDVVARLRTFVRDNAGKPLYLEMGSFVQQAIVAQIEQTEGQVDEEDAPRRRLTSGRERVVVGAINRHKRGGLS